MIDEAHKVQDRGVRKEVDMRGIRGRRRQMNMQIVEPMRCHRHAESLSDRSDLTPLTDASAYRSVSLQYGGGLSLEQLFVPPTTGLDLARRHRDVGELR